MAKKTDTASKKKLPVIDTTGDANDDWMQKSNPEAYAQELKIHEELAAKYAAEAKAKAEAAKKKGTEK